MTLPYFLATGYCNPAIIKDNPFIFFGIFRDKSDGAIFNDSEFLSTGETLCHFKREPAIT